MVRTVQLRKNVGSGIASALLVLATLAITYPVFLRTLGPKLFGLWLLMATVLNLAQMSSLGMGPALARLISHEYGKNSVEALGRHWASAVALLCGTGLVVLAGVFSLRSPVMDLLRIDAELIPAARMLMPMVAALATLMLIVEATGAVLVGIGRSDLNSYAQAAAQTTTSLLPILLIQSGFGVMSFPIAIFAAYSLTEIFLLALLQRHVGLHRLAPLRFSLTSVRELLRVGFALSGSSVVQLVLVSSLRVLLSRYAGLTAIPIYDLAYNGSFRLRNVIETGLRAMMPEISHLRSASESRSAGQIRRLYHRTALFTFGAGALIYLTVGISSGFVLRLWLGSSYTPEFLLALRLGLLGTFLSLVGVPAYYTLMGLGTAWPLLLEKTLHAIVQMSLLAGFLPLLGQLNSALVLATGAAGMGASTLYLLWKARAATRVESVETFLLPYETGQSQESSL